MFAHQTSQEFRHQATAHLAQTMSFLQLSTAELEATLLKEINENPALELTDERLCPNCGKRLKRLPCPACATPRNDTEPIVYLSPRPTSVYHSSRDENDEPLEASTPERLDEYILQQIALTLTVAERPIAAYILARLDEDGLLPETPPEIALYLRAPLKSVEHVLHLIQHADPPGVAAHTPQAALLVQLENLAETEAGRREAHLIALARQLIQNHFPSLSKHEYHSLAKQLRVQRALVEATAHFIQRNLTPYPARAFWGESKLPAANSAGLRQADVNITTFNQSAAGGPLMVEVFTPLAGQLRVNPAFKAALAECPEADQPKWQTALERALLIAKCVQQRNHTMRRLMLWLVQAQQPFIVGGDGDLRPLTRAQIARELGLHESTISRAVAGKCVALPNGRIVPLARFFDRSLSVRDRVRHLVESELKPLTDDEIAAALAGEGVQVARRTVAKYRNMLGILPAALRARIQPTPNTP